LRGTKLQEHLGGRAVAVVQMSVTVGATLVVPATGIMLLFLTQKKLEKRRGAKYNTPFLGDFWHQKTCFGGVFKKTADLSLSIVNFFPFIFPFNHIVFPIVVIWEMSQKKITGRDFTIDLGDDHDDFGF